MRLRISQVMQSPVTCYKKRVFIFNPMNQGWRLEKCAAQLHRAGQVFIQSLWRVRDMLTEHGGRTVVPESLSDRVLSTLHSAHQGTTCMRFRAEKTMFWPNMAADIANTRNHCSSCCAQFPGQSAEPPITLAPSGYPFQHICSDYLSVAGLNFCLVVDRFSNWLQVYSGKGARNLIHLLGESFHSFGIPKSLTSNQGVAAAET